MPHFDTSAVPEMSEYTSRDIIESLAEACRVGIGKPAARIVGTAALTLSSEHVGCENLCGGSGEIFVQGACAIVTARM